MTTKGKDESPRPRGRKRAFDESAALERAVTLFWERGYEGVSIADLTAAMGIAPPSLYAAFGSKEELYRRALEQYRESPWGSGLARALRGEGTALAAVTRLLRESARDFTTPGHPAGCMISTAVLGCATENEGAARLTAALRKEALSMLQKRFEAAVEAGELPRKTDVRALARFYGAVIQGMSVQARDGADERALRGLANAALAAWPSAPSDRSGF